MSETQILLAAKQLVDEALGLAYQTTLIPEEIRTIRKANEVPIKLLNAENNIS